MEKNKIIFLDFDGVMDTCFMKISLTKEKQALSDEYGILFDEQCVENLRKIICATNADIVVTSSWKLDMSLKKLQEMWSYRKLPEKVIDVTPNLIGSRGDEISAWLEEHEAEVGKYAIIDDMPSGFFIPHFANHLFSVDSNVGLDNKTTQIIIYYFERENLIRL